MVMRFLPIVVLLAWLCGCQGRVPMWQVEAGAALDKIRLSGADVLLPLEYRGVEESYALGNSYLKAGDYQNAEKVFHSTFRNAEALEKRLAEERSKIEENSSHMENIGEKETERQQKAEEKVRDQGEKREPSEKPKKTRERILASAHTVKRGETLPYIAALPEVFNDPSLWPLLYRANRDQIRDPNYIWPGQVLRIPRNLSREDTNCARKSTHE